MLWQQEKKAWAIVSAFPALVLALHAGTIGVANAVLVMVVAIVASVLLPWGRQAT